MVKDYLKTLLHHIRNNSSNWTPDCEAECQSAIEGIAEEFEKLQTAVYQAGNIASCLANGIKPD